MIENSPKLQDSWNGLDLLGEKYLSLSTNITRSAKKLCASIANGDLDNCIPNLNLANENLIEMASCIQSTRTAIESHLKQTFSEFKQEFEKACRAKFGQQIVYLIGNDIVVYPSVVRLSEKSGVISALIGGKSIRGTRISNLLDLVESDLKSNFNYESFKTSLHKSYEIITRNERGKEASLEEIRTIMSLTRDSQNRYSKGEFNADIQRLHSKLEQDPSLLTIRFIPVAAAAVQFSLFSIAGSVINVASMLFEPKA